MFELFRSKAIPELASIRSTGFWHNVVLPACYSEPAILHASIALACEFGLCAEPKSSSQADDNESVRLDAVVEYNKAIYYLKEHITKQSNARSSRAILITCVLFITLELFTGRLQKATIHLDQGRKLLLQSYIAQSNGSTTDAPENETKALVFASNPESVEDELVNIFAHLDIQSTYFGSNRPQLKLATHSSITSSGKSNCPKSPTSLVVPSSFHSIHEANQHLVIIMNESLTFVGHSFDAARHTLQNQLSNFHRQYLYTHLQDWRQAYERLCLEAKPQQRSDRMWKEQSALMLIQHAWLSVIVPSSYLEIEETEYDSYLRHFTTIVDLVSSISLQRDEEKTGSDHNHFTFELGVVPPLWWTVMKCREPSIRRKALSLLSQVGREGLWDPVLMHYLGREIILLEEEVEAEGMRLASSYFSLNDECIDEKEDLSTLIPLHRRISAATVSFNDKDPATFQMAFLRKQWDCDGVSTSFEQIVRDGYFEGRQRQSQRLSKGAFNSENK
ncbi:hypothetical protein AOQ84DRAFT_225993 [Glonium stellatum]|uniref:Uncharacterized protein n=1 Tax=Glonium stellatum TaxID=574774 RepID=A0A8E2ET75_9PEZI|nr:hypothetical protein AOQ84DRAFT_225993 [Glonium stellatum]